MRLVFAGTPEFAQRSLAAIAAAGHEVALVLTQPDRAAGRGLRPMASAVKQYAQANGLAVEQPERLKDAGVLDRVRDAAPDVLVVAAYGAILPRAFLDLARHGALNIHASLLPRWRGAAPIQRALLAGDRETGITIMQMDEGLDTGAMLLQRALPIGPQDDAGSLHDSLAAMGAQMIVEVLDALAHAPLESRPQPAEGVTYAHKIQKSEAQLDWHRPAEELERQVRAFRPSPGAWTTLHGEVLKIWRGRLAAAGDIALPPGTLSVAEGALRVACGRGALLVEELQRAGGKRISAGEFLRGRADLDGSSLGRAVD